MNVQPAIRLRRLGAGLLTALLALLAVLGVLDIATRLLDPGREALPFRGVDVFEDRRFRPAAMWGTRTLKNPSPFTNVLTGEYIPGLRFRFIYPSNPRGYFDADHAVEAAINTSGLRGPEIASPKPRGSFRVLCVGDSFTFGEGVREEDTFVARLRTLLGCGGDGARCEVINCGVSSYNTADEIAYLENVWVNLEPDLVLIVFVINDAYSDAVFGPLHRGWVEGVTRLSEARYIAGSRFLAVAYDRLLRWRKARETRRIYLSQFTESPLISGHNWDDCRAALARAADLARERQFRLGLVIFPELYRLDNRYPFASAHRLVADEAARLGIPVLDLLDAFRGRDARALWVHPTDHHPNEEAHRIAAEAIHGFLDVAAGDLGT